MEQEGSPRKRLTTNSGQQFPFPWGHDRVMANERGIDPAAVNVPMRQHLALAWAGPCAKLTIIMGPWRLIFAWDWLPLPWSRSSRSSAKFDIGLAGLGQRRIPYRGHVVPWGPSILGPRGPCPMDNYPWEPRGSEPGVLHRDKGFIGPRIRIQRAGPRAVPLWPRPFSPGGHTGALPSSVCFWPSSSA